MSSRCFLGLLLMSCSSAFFLSVSATSAQAQAGGTLQWRANLAKSQGQTSTGMLLHIEPFDYTSTLSETATQSLLVDGVVESSVVYGAPDSINVETWYKVKVLWRGPEPSVHPATVKETIPEQLRDLRPDEILLMREGGTVIVDGVSITERGVKPLAVTKRYLFVLESLRNASAYTTTLTEPVEVDDQGNIVHPAKMTVFSRSIAGYRGADELERYVQQITQKHL